MRSFLKRIITPALLFVVSVFAQASEPETALILNLKDGTQEYFFLADKPVIYFDGTSLKFKSSDFSAEMDDVVKFYFDENVDREAYEHAVSIIGLNGEKKLVFTYLDGKNVRMQGITSADQIKVYSVDGRLVNAAIFSVEGGFNVCLDAQPAGVYVIRTNNQSFKITKK